jgi:hypothetical protein
MTVFFHAKSAKASLDRAFNEGVNLQFAITCKLVYHRVTFFGLFRCTDRISKIKTILDWKQYRSHSSRNALGINI